MMQGRLGHYLPDATAAVPITDAPAKVAGAGRCGNHAIDLGENVHDWPFTLTNAMRTKDFVDSENSANAAGDIRFPISS